MKKKIIAAMLIGTVTVTSITGCGVKIVENAATAPESYIEAEYPEEADSPEEYPAPANSPEEYPEEAATEETTEAAAEAPAEAAGGIEVYTDSESAAYDTAPEYPETTADSTDAGSSDINIYGNTAAKSAGADTCDSYVQAPMEAAEICGLCEEEACRAYPSKESCLTGIYYPAPAEGENYKSIIENSFTDALTNPLSTFGADIDTASYANLRRMINDGFKLSDIPAGSIRTEELINYFNYDYRRPKNSDIFAVKASIIDCPWNEESKLVNLGIRAKDMEDIDDIASNIVFLVDVSGSMDSYDKLPLLQMGLENMVDSLDKNDRVSIVTYASSSDVVIAGVPGSKHSKIKRAINNLSAAGSTNGGDGIRTAYKLAEKYFIKNGNNRVIMATDGDLNVGITSEDELEELISDKKESGVFLSVLGFGTGNYNEVTLETLADKGNGNYSYIDCLSEAKKVLIDEFNSTLFTVAKDVKFQTEFNPKYVSEYRLVGYENRQMASKDFDDDNKDGGEIGSGHAITVMYEIKLNGDSDNKTGSLRYQNSNLTEAGKNTDEWMTVSVRYKEPDEDISKLIRFPVSSKCYTYKPDCDTLFAAYVAECGMIINDSDYIKGLSLNDVSKQMARLNLDDEYKEEFLDLIRQI